MSIKILKSICLLFSLIAFSFHIDAQPDITEVSARKWRFKFKHPDGTLLHQQKDSFSIDLKYLTYESNDFLPITDSLKYLTSPFQFNEVTGEYQFNTFLIHELKIQLTLAEDTMTVFTTMAIDSLVFSAGDYVVDQFNVGFYTGEKQLSDQVKIYGGSQIINVDHNFGGSNTNNIFPTYYKISDEESAERYDYNYRSEFDYNKYFQLPRRNKTLLENIKKDFPKPGPYENNPAFYPLEKETFIHQHRILNKTDYDGTKEDSIHHRFSITRDLGKTWTPIIGFRYAGKVNYILFHEIGCVAFETSTYLLITDFEFKKWKCYRRVKYPNPNDVSAKVNPHGLLTKRHFEYFRGYGGHFDFEFYDGLEGYLD